MFWLLLEVLIALLVIIFSFKYYMNSNNDFWPKLGIPFVEPIQIGTMWNRMWIPLHEMDNIIYNKLKSFGKPDMKYGGYMESRNPIAYAMDLDLIKNINVKDFDNFVNRRGIELRDDDPTLFHKMLFNVENQKWKDLRSAMSPAFSTGKIKKMFDIITLSAKRMVSFTESEVTDKNEIEISDVCGRFTMDVIASAAFGVDSNNFANKNSLFASMAQKFGTQFDGFGGIKLLLAIWIPAVFRFFRFSLLDRDAVEFFSKTIKNSIEHRKSTGVKRTDFLQLLLDAREGQLRDDDEEDHDSFDKIAKLRNYKASSVEFTDELIVAQSLLFYLAGFHTAQTLMLFVLYEICVNPDVQERLAKVIAKAAATEEGLTYDVLNSIEYLDMVVSETLRKYPPSTRAERRSLSEYDVPGCAPLDKGRIIVIPIMQIHNDPDYYPEPEKFIPERFSAENKAGRNPYCYLPFGVGPRSCIARRFAITESKCAVAHLVHNFKIEPSEKTQIPMEVEWKLIIKPKNGMWLKLTPRNSQPQPS